jgi:glycosyltransferase involved in cell wall biosynthesis
MNPLVSVLMPVYKTAPYLSEAMDSMLHQTFKDYELIVLDDCSPDNAEEILDAYDDSRIVRYKGENNVGLSNVLNVGIEMARGKYIARMDSDDISLPNRLQIQVDYLEAHSEIDLVSVGMQLFGVKESVWIRERNPEKVKIEALFHSPVLHASSMWRKDSFERHGLRFRQEMVPAEDYDLWVRAMLKGLKLVNLPEVLYEYRIHEAQATVQTDKTAAKSREVQMAYLQEALPSLSDRNREAFPKRLWPVFFANLRDGFFDKKMLAKRLYKMSKNRK